MFGTPFFLLPQAQFPGGVDLGPVGVIPTGGSVAAYVRSTGPQDGDSLDLTSRLVPTLNAGLARCRSGRGDTVIVLPNHAENIATADAMSSLVAGTRIIGYGYGDDRPTFTWTANAATFLFDVANVILANCRLFLAGPHAAGTATTVAAPITVSAAGCSIVGCDIWAGFDADQIVTIGVTTTAASDRFKFLGNRVRGEAAAVGTTFLRLVGCDDCEVAYNDIVYGTSAAAVGPIQALTTASTGVNIHHNSVQNNAASSTAAITGMAGLTGHIAHNLLRNMTDASVAWIATPGNAQLFQNYGVNNNGETGILAGTPSV